MHASADLIITACATAAAAGALAWSIHASRTRATFDHLRAVQHRLEPVWGDPEIERAEHELLAWHGGDGAELSTRARAYLGLLTELDLLAFACAKGLVRSSVAKEWLRTLFEREVAVSAAYLVQLQQAVQDPAAFEHLLRFIRKEFSTEPETETSR